MNFQSNNLKPYILTYQIKILLVKIRVLLLLLELKEKSMDSKIKRGWKELLFITLVLDNLNLIIDHSYLIKYIKLDWYCEIYIYNIKIISLNLS
jgi:hypothetical protein